MINVIKNAIEAVGHDGHIEFTAGLVDDLVSISIIDSGVGLQSGTVDRLFAPFYTTKPEGQGLGLMLVKQILVEHGFDFSLRAIDGRTHFTIRVPVVGSELSGQTGAQSSHPAEKGVRVPSHVVPE
jgi:signal transduction histidine kinase